MPQQKVESYLSYKQLQVQINDTLSTTVILRFSKTLTILQQYYLLKTQVHS